MRNSIRVKTVAFLAASVAAATTLTASPSHATYSPLQLWEHTSHEGAKLSLWSSESNLGWNRSFGDVASSLRNLSDKAWVVYDDSGYSDRRYCIKAGQSISNLHSDAWNFGDKISSAKVLSTAGCGDYPTF